MVPRSVSEVSAPSLLPSPCKSSTFCATTVPFAFCHGPLPIRSRALMAPPAALVLRYARQVLLPAPAVCANFWQCRSAPSSPPRSAPLPGPVLVTKKLISGACGTCCACMLPPCASNIAADASTDQRMDMVFLPLNVDFPFEPGSPRSIEILAHVPEAWEPDF